MQYKPKVKFYDNAYIWEDAIAVTADGEVTGIDAALLSMTNSNFNGGIAGTVVDNSGSPLSGVLMTIKNNSGDIVGYDFSDSQGGYQIAGVENGSYIVQASKVSYDSDSEDVEYESENGGTEVINFSLPQTPTSVEGENTVLPKKIELAQNYPNPFNPVTNISFKIDRTQHVNLSVFNVLGQLVKTLIDGQVTSGEHTVTWNAANMNGQNVSTGIYFYSLKTSETTIVNKMILSK